MEWWFQGQSILATFINRRTNVREVSWLHMTLYKWNRYQHQSKDRDNLKKCWPYPWGSDAHADSKKTHQLTSMKCLQSGLRQ